MKTPRKAGEHRCIKGKMTGWAYKVIGLPTRNRAAAIQMVKHDIARNGAIAQALQSMRHSV